MKAIETDVNNVNSEEEVNDVHQRAKERNYWLNKLSGDLVKTSFPFDAYKTNLQKPGLESVSFSIDQQAFSRLMRLSNNSDIRLYIILMTLGVLLLEKYTGNKDITVGAPIYRQDTEGDFVNKIVVLRNRLKDDMSFKELLLQVSQTNFEAMEHINYPLETIPYELNMSFPGKEFPLFDVAILLENLHDKSYLQHLHLAVIISFTRKDNSIQGIVEYNNILYRQETIKRIISHFNNLADRALSDIDTSLANLSVMSDQEIKQLVEDVNATRVNSPAYPAGKMIQQLFHEQVQRTPGNIALQYKDRCLTYRELEDISNRLARRLNGCGVGKETIVAILLKNTMELIAAVLAILKAGAAYLPIDPEYLTARINYMLEDSQTRYLITGKDFREKFQFSGARRTIFYVEDLELLENLPVSASEESALTAPNYAHQPGQLAYVMYTSGSTGKPKGVMIHHSSLVNYVWWAAQTYVRGEALNFPLYSSISFDLTVTSIFTPLITGNTIIIYGGGESNFLIEEIIEEGKVGIIKLTPSHLYLIKYKNFQQSKVKRFIVGGEIFETRIAREITEKFKGNIEIYNEYGPTEATVGCLIYRYNPGEDNYASVPIGVPIAETQIYLLDYNYRPVPIGVSGEIFVSGKGVARGYLNSPGLTAEKFIELKIMIKVEEAESPRQQIPNKHTSDMSHKSPAYRTGDLARWLPEGNLEFLGRVDHQVKIRGYRIELAEIEQELLKHELVKEALVIARDAQEKSASEEKQDQYLCAYFVPAGELQTSELREHLLTNLPDYMVPLFFVPLEAIPLTSNGKIDRKMLPVPEIKKETNYAAPRDDMEKKLVTIWAKVLRIEKDVISIDASFFELGGQSLKQVDLISQIQKEFNVNISLAAIFERQTIRELAEYIQGAKKEEFISIKPVEEREYYDLSSAQRRMYVISQLDPEKALYNVSRFVTLNREIDREKLEKTVQLLIDRHEALRTSFIVVEGNQVQKIDKNTGLKIEYHDLEGKYELNTPASARQIKTMIQGFIRPFDFTRAPLFRVGIIKLGISKFILMFDIHHIVNDGISMDIMFREFDDLYEGKDLPPLYIQYKDYSQWLNSEQIKEKIKTQQDYWVKEFETDIPVLNLPTDYPRPLLQDFEGGRIHFNIPRETCTGLQQLAMQHEATLYMIVTAALYILLFKLSGQEDIVVGTPVAGRRHADLDNIIGLFINTLALRLYPRGEQNIPGFLQEVKIKTMQAFENQEYQFEDLLENVQVKRDISRNPLFDIMLSWYSLSRNKEMEAAPGLPSKENREKNLYDYSRVLAKFDLLFYGTEYNGEVFFELDYAAKLFKEETILRFVDYFKRIISAILAAPHQEISQIDILSREEKNRVLYELNQPQKEYPEDKTIHGLFAEQVEQGPDHIAAVGPSFAYAHPLQLSYRELDRRAGRLARRLHHSGVQPDTLVGIMLERSLEIIIGIMGILKSGAAYLPIDAEYPEDRINYMLSDSRAKILVTTPGLSEKFEKLSIGNSRLLMPAPGTPGAWYDGAGMDEAGDKVSPANLAYIIYTSGTTGKPKGALLEHKNVVSLLFNEGFQFDFNHTDTWTLFHSFGFDFSVWEMFGALLYGGRLVLVPWITARDPIGFREILINQKVTVLNQTPSSFYNLIYEELKSSEKKLCLRYVIFGGEALKPGKLKEWQQKYPGTKLVNMFGITEICIHGTYKETGEAEIMDDISNIGKPLPTLSVYIMDQYMKLLPVGVPGELYLAGKGIARGYLNQPGLTADKFVKNPYKGSERLYRSGDMVKWHPEGEMVYLGRLDHQVQLRGFRIELGEIENRLLKFHPVKEAVVIDRTSSNADLYLCAYIVPRAGLEAGDLDVRALREFLSGQLPDYMIPSYFVPLERIPVNANGKIHRKALPDPSGMELDTGVTHEAPRNEIEQILAETWQTILGRSMIGMNDNFFEIGGDSIKAIQVTARLLNYNLKLEIRDFFLSPSIRQLTLHVKPMEFAIHQGPVQGEVRLTPIQEWFFQQDFTLPHHYNQAVLLHSRKRLNQEHLKRVFQRLAEHHDALRMVFIKDKTSRRIKQVNRGIDQPLVDFYFFDITEPAAGADEPGQMEKIIMEKCTAIQASMDLARGPLLKLGLFGTKTGDYLLIALHHLVVDGFSWRILLEDISTLYLLLDQGKEMKLPLKTTSYKEWSEKMSLYANSSKFLEELPYWQAQEQEAKTRESLPVDRGDRDASLARQKSTRTETFHLTPADTEKLLKNVNRAYNTEINDILLTALALAIKKWTGIGKIFIQLEGHGRENIMEKIDISRTIGWFTSLYPVFIDLDHQENDHDPGEPIKKTKEILRHIPAKGIGYGILKYLTSPANKVGMTFARQPEISFNYLGQFDQDANPDLFTPSGISPGITTSLESERLYRLDIAGMTFQGVFKIIINYSADQYDSRTIAVLAGHFKRQLEEIISHCSQKQETELTISDFTSTDLDEQEMDGILGELEEEFEE